jgi:hypothetical protein
MYQDSTLHFFNCQMWCFAFTAVCCLDAIANLSTLQQVTAYRVPLLMSARASTRTSSWCLSLIARVTTGFFITALIQPLKGKN